ncbi:MAG: hypothetical protein V3S41_04145 [Spirochaetia bacterium]
MAKDQLEQFLSESVIAKRATVPARVIFRRARMTSGELGRALEANEVTIGGQPECRLVAGGTVIAAGEIVERDGRYFFQAKESTE